jgi:muramoyltetrapeptide carboxypeptidase
MRRPAYLKPGDKIGLVSPAKTVQAEQVKAAMRVLQRWELEPVFGRHIFSTHHQFAGTDEQRASDLQHFLDDTSIKAIISTRGGYGSHRIIDQLDFSKFSMHPKWLIGYSDITVFHSHIHQQLGIETIHGIMPLNFPSDFTENESLSSLKKALFGDLEVYDCKDCEILRTGNACAPLVGGNLAILISILGTKSELNTNGKILFLEDVGENLFRIDRYIFQMKRAGKLKNLKGLILGGFTDMEDNDIAFGKTAQEIIFDAVKEYSFPVLNGFPAGHQKQNLSLFLGREIELNASNLKKGLIFL